MIQKSVSTDSVKDGLCMYCVCMYVLFMYILIYGMLYVCVYVSDCTCVYVCLFNDRTSLLVKAHIGCTCICMHVCIKVCVR